MWWRMFVAWCHSVMLGHMNRVDDDPVAPAPAPVPTRTPERRRSGREFVLWNRHWSCCFHEWTSIIRSGKKRSISNFYQRRTRDK